MGIGPRGTPVVRGADHLLAARLRPAAPPPGPAHGTPGGVPAVGLRPDLSEVRGYVGSLFPNALRTASAGMGLWRPLATHPQGWAYTPCGESPVNGAKSIGDAKWGTWPRDPDTNVTPAGGRPHDDDAPDRNAAHPD